MLQQNVSARAKRAVTHLEKIHRQLGSTMLTPFNARTEGWRLHCHGTDGSHGHDGSYSRLLLEAEGADANASVLLLLSVLLYSGVLCMSDVPSEWGVLELLVEVEVAKAAVAAVSVASAEPGGVMVEEAEEVRKGVAKDKMQEGCK